MFLVITHDAFWFAIRPFAVRPWDSHADAAQRAVVDELTYLEDASESKLGVPTFIAVTTIT
jgi:hypothetical protein